MSFLAMDLNGSKHGWKKETAKGRKDGRKEGCEEGCKEGCRYHGWGFWLYRLKGMRCKKRVVGSAAKVSSRGQGGGTVFSRPPGIKERRSTGASTNYYCTLPPGRRQGRRCTTLFRLDSSSAVVRVSRCPFYIRIPFFSSFF